ncbi:ABC transporter ATP-binding protein [Thermoflexibacter ruber]|uniref:ABC-2 type transport system ATP-binding protein n=1 Tax=Thermoflexibacter ruber TaxID=1003 RepID=A0A1I2JS49_9BACT|nr:ABC transporter ATP-binding protein [Thermoflexibacter ruber]SFF56803.1 ABC-2 type transport system ATP-binding protein [Thermoflexibacter ruber]
MIILKNIKKKYDKQEVLKGVSLEVATGCVQALLGANGAGKSTLIKILSCILKRNGGGIEIDSEQISLDSYEYRRKVGYVFDQPIYIEKFSAREYLEFVAEMYELPKQDYKPRIEELLAFMELPIDNKKWIEDYSKGMKAKVSLAAALIHQPKYLILDEPFDGVDFVSVQKICKLFRSMASKGACILITSHQYDIIAEVCDRFALLKEGEIKFNLTMSELENQAVLHGFGEDKNPVKAYLESLMSNSQKNEISFL